MHGATWHIEKVTSLDRNFGQKMIPVLALDLLTELFLALGIVTVDNLCPFVCSDNIPAFSLAKLSFVF